MVDRQDRRGPRYAAATCVNGRSGYRGSYFADASNPKFRGDPTMTIKVEKLEREFVFDGKTLPDPNPDMAVEQVREMYIPAHPEITTATVTGPEPVDGKMRYTFSRAIGAKG